MRSSTHQAVVGSQRWPGRTSNFPMVLITSLGSQASQLLQGISVLLPMVKNSVHACLQGPTCSSTPSSGSSCRLQPLCWWPLQCGRRPSVRAPMRRPRLRWPSCRGRTMRAGTPTSCTSPLPTTPPCVPATCVPMHGPLIVDLASAPAARQLLPACNVVHFCSAACLSQ